MPPTPQPPPDEPEWELPKLRASFGFEDDFKYIASDQQLEQEADTEFFDVKFYPYKPVGSSTVFAAVSKKHVVVCRLSHPSDKDKNPCEIIQVIRDDDDGALNCSCCWTKEAGTERALLCVAGRDAKIKIYSLKDAKVHRILLGHGGEINDLSTSPANPRIIASASDDTTVRIWSLDPVHAKQPCVCLLGGEGHSSNLLSVAFHGTGRYVLSAGHDQIINMWTIPDLPNEPVDVPQVVHYPHFSTSSMHSGLVDCVSFLGDLILSRACHEDMIVLWRIEGFSSQDPPPSPSTAPTAYDTSKPTRSAFVSTTAATTPSPLGRAAYTRLLQFATPGCGPQFFMRFSTYQGPGMGPAHVQHPVLAFCNAASKIMFWDFARLTAYQKYVTEAQDVVTRGGDVGAVPRPPWLKPIQHRKAGEGAAGVAVRVDPASKTREGSDEAKAAQKSTASNKNSSSTTTTTITPSRNSDTATAEAVATVDALSREYGTDTFMAWDAKYSIEYPHGTIKPHREELVGRGSKEDRRKKLAYGFVGRQVAWSPGGEWCVVVGSQNLAVILQRWAPEKGDS